MDVTVQLARNSLQFVVDIFQERKGEDLKFAYQYLPIHQRENLVSSSGARPSVYLNMGTATLHCLDSCLNIRIIELSSSNLPAPDTYFMSIPQYMLRVRGLHLLS